jgi:phage N-6-adenine-methyltransferase
MMQAVLPLGLAENPPPSEELDEQYTPTNDRVLRFASLMKEFRFTLDPCATKESAKCTRFFTKKENGLRQSWRGERVWLNCPYSNIGMWLDKASEEMDEGCKCVVALLPAWTDRKWWHSYIEPFRIKRDGPEVRFLKGRIIFGYPGNPEGRLRGAGGKKRGGGKFPSVLVIWRAKGLVIPDPRQVEMFGRPVPTAQDATA